jgi:hypothetical protein
MIIQPTYLSPLPQGKSLRIAKESVTGAGAKAWTSQTESDAVLVSLFVESAAGNLTVDIYTQTDEGRDLLVATFPVVSSPTTNLLIKKAATIINQIKVVATWTGPVSYELYLRGVSGADTGVKILGATDAHVKQQNLGPTTSLLIPAALVARTGLVVKNNNPIGGAMVYFGFTALEATAAVGYPLGAQESIGMDLASGVEIYGVSTSGTSDMRIIESGG